MAEQTEIPNTNKETTEGGAAGAAGAAAAAGGSAADAGGAAAGGAGAAAAGGAAGSVARPGAAAAGGQPNRGKEKPKGNAGSGGGGGTEIRMSSKALRERIDRDAAAKIRRTLGCTLEEAQARLKAAPTAAAAVSTANADAAGAGGSGRKDEVERLRRQLADKTARLEAQKTKTEKLKVKERDKRTSLELRYSAVAAGILDEHADFAMDQYAKAIRATPQGTDVPTPQAFWPALLKARPYLSQAVAPTTVELRPTTAPPESRLPGEETPASPAPGERAKERKVEDLSDEEFAARTSRLYKFRVPA